MISQCFIGGVVASETDVKHTPVNADSEILEDVTVTGSTGDSNYSDSGFNVDNVTVDDFMNSPTDINQILKTTPGVIIRETGGLGSSFNLSLNGLSGNRVRYFVDGVPMENFGSALTLNNFPVNLINGIEVFKGVTPISLSADALGGAINILTLPAGEEFLDASYTYGSFNTHRAALLAQTTYSDHAYFRLTSFYNHSDNDYWMDNVPMVDALGNKLGTMRAKRFHDDYTSAMLSIKSGLLDTNLADDLSLSLTYAENRNDEQHPDTSINKVFGGYYSTNKTALASITYKKTFEKLTLRGYFLSGTIEDSTFDILSRKYDWNGNYTIRADQNSGELGSKSIFDRKDSVIRSSLFGEYSISSQSNMALSLAVNNLDRSGNDRINKNNTSFTEPNFVNRLVAAGSYGFNTSDEKFNTSLFVKKYLYNAEINATQFLKDGTLANVRTLVDLDVIGYGWTASYKISNALGIKSSYEKAFRLPEPDEILGSGKYIRPNPNLKPEESQNFNLGFQYQLNRQAVDFMTDANIFYRNASNFIHYVANQVIFGNYENIGNVRVQGIETSVSLMFKRRYSLGMNATWQDMTDRTRIDSDGQLNNNFGSKIPNEPYLFANLRGGAFFNFHSKNQFSVYWTLNYVHKYFLKWENSGNPDDKYFIPTQLTNDIDIEYSMGHGRYNISLSARNIFDEQVYDNFDIQKPGRAFYLKMRYFY